MIKIPVLKVEINRLIDLAFDTNDAIERLEALEMIRDLLDHAIDERKTDIIKRDKNRRKLFWEE